jgi:hypothetical protein
MSIYKIQANGDEVRSNLLNESRGTGLSACTHSAHSFPEPGFINRGACRRDEPGFDISALNYVAQVLKDAYDSPEDSLFGRFKFMRLKCLNLQRSHFAASTSAAAEPQKNNGAEAK